MFGCSLTCSSPGSVYIPILQFQQPAVVYCVAILEYKQTVRTHAHQLQARSVQATGHRLIVSRRQNESVSVPFIHLLPPLLPPLLLPPLPLLLPPWFLSCMLLIQILSHDSNIALYNCFTPCRGGLAADACLSRRVKQHCSDNPLDLMSDHSQGLNASNVILCQWCLLRYTTADACFAC